MQIEVTEIIELLVIGLTAGGLGGMMGIGGSVIMIPAMAVVFHGRDWDDQHLFQAAAMIVNMAVALPAALRHRKAGAVPWPFVRFFLPVTMVCIVAGVVISNQIDAENLRRIFAAFLVYVVASNIVKIFRRHPDHTDAQSRTGPPRAVAVGAVTGVASGILGIGGGIVSIPLMQLIVRLPLKKAIAASATAMVFSAPVGAALKVATLGQHDQSWTSAVVIAATLIPTAILGAHVGAGLTHTVKLETLRLVFALVLLAMAARMAGVL